MLALAAALVPLTVQAAPPNDTCPTASGLTTTAPQLFEIPEDTTSSGFGAAELPLGQMENDVFFTFFPPEDGGYALSVSSSRFVPRLAAYEDGSCSGELLSESNAQATSGVTTWRFLRLDGLTAGQPVLLQLGTSDASDDGLGELKIGQADLAGGETCDEPTIVPGLGAFTIPLMRSPISVTVGGQNAFNQAFFRFTVPTDGAYRISTLMSQLAGSLRVFDGADCSATLLVDADDGEAIVTGLTAGDELLIAVELSTTDTTDQGVLEIVPAQSGPGETCDDAIALLGFNSVSTSASSIVGPDVPSSACDPTAPELFHDLFFSFTVPAAIEFEVTARYAAFSGVDGEVRLFHGASCGGTCIDRAFGVDRTVTIPSSPPGTVFTVQLGTLAPLSLQQLEDLLPSASVTPVDSCALNPPDGFEPNDSCNVAVDLESGGYPTLHLGRGDRDHFRVKVLPGETLTVTLNPTGSNDATGILLRTPNSGCGPQYAGSPPSMILAQSAAFNFFTPVSWTNTSSRIQDVFLLVREFNDPVAQNDCRPYGLLVEGAAPLGTIGEAYCTGTPNSTGGAGQVTAFGSSLVSDNDVTLRAFNLPAGTFGILLASMGRDADPAWNGGAGVLCLDQPIGRISGPAGVFQSDAAGQFEHPLDLSAVPLGSAAPAVTPGDTLHFAAWHRDVLGGSAASNLTEGFTVWFQ